MLMSYKTAIFCKEPFSACFFFLHNAAVLMRGFLTLPLGGVNQGKGREGKGRDRRKRRRRTQNAINFNKHNALIFLFWRSELPVFVEEMKNW